MTKSNGIHRVDKAQKENINNKQEQYLLQTLLLLVQMKCRM